VRPASSEFCLTSVPGGLPVAKFRQLPDISRNIRTFVPQSSGFSDFSTRFRDTTPSLLATQQREN
jgi:hypothetical protein